MPKISRLEIKNCLGISELEIQAGKVNIIKGDYCKENCSWVTPKEQANNQRSNRIVVVKGECLTLAQACDKYGTPYGRANNRLRLGWPDERAILAPKGERLHG